MISVLISLHCSEEPDFLKDCLNSLAIQTFKDFEVILVVDGFFDPLHKNIIDHFSKIIDIHIYINNINMGLGYSLNFGLSKCNYEYVARMDTDDVCFPDRLAKQYFFLKENSSISVLGTSFYRFDKNNFSLVNFPEHHNKITSFLYTCPIAHPSVMFRKSDVLSCGSYDKKLRRRQDLHLWFKLYDRGFLFHNLQVPLLYYRFSNNTHKRAIPYSMFMSACKCSFICLKRFSTIYFIFFLFIPFVRSLMPFKFQVLFYNITSFFRKKLLRS